MKNTKINKVFFAVIASSITISSFAQGSDKNMAKVNVSSFAFKGFSVQYERQIAKRFTVALGYGSIPYSTIAFQSTIDNYAKDAEVEVGKFKLGTSVFTPELRYYVGRKGAYRGFYLAPYARISTYKMQVPMSYTSGTTTRTALFDGKINNTTGGLMLGSQWKLSEHLYLDWWIVGASIGSASGNLVAITPLNATEQAEVQKQINDIDIPFTDIKSEVNSSGAKVTTTGSMAGARGLGINLGFRF